MSGRAFIAVILAAAMVVAFIGDLLAQSPNRNAAASQVSVGATATLTAGFRANRSAVTIQNHGATAMFCGPSSAVTTTTGFRLPGTDGASITIETQANIYCITAAGSQTVSVLESY